MKTIDESLYGQLLRIFQPKVIENEEEYNRAREVLRELMMKTEITPEETELLKLIATLIKQFDDKQEQNEPASPHQVLLHLMQEHNIRPIDLVGKLGSKEIVSAILDQQHSISESQAEILGEIFHVSPSVFIG